MLGYSVYLSAFGNLLASWSLPHSSSSLSVSMHFRLCTEKSMPFGTAGTQVLSKPDRQQAQSTRLANWGQEQE